MTPSEWTNSEWLEALKADRESAWAALRGRVVRGLLGYLHSNRLPGIEERALQALVEDAAQETLHGASASALGAPIDPGPQGCAS
jgi:hypothetical protein